MNKTEQKGCKLIFTQPFTSAILKVILPSRWFTVQRNQKLGIFLIEPLNVYTVPNIEIILALKLKISNIRDTLSDYNMLSPGCNKKSAVFTPEN